MVVTLAAAVLVAAIGWLLGPGASWWLEHVDGVTGLTGEKLAAAVDAVRGCALAVATGLAALAAVFSVPPATPTPPGTPSSLASAGTTPTATARPPNNSATPKPPSD
ncbi:hypothetical protein ACWDA3_27680 [Nonomuraea rubra]